MPRIFPIGQKITVCLISQNLTVRVVCDAVVTDNTQLGPSVVITYPAFAKPLELVLSEVLIETTPHGMAYSGEVEGAVIIPRNLWA